MSLSAENSQSVRGRPFAKGKSGNPGGRPKGVAEVVAAARSHTSAAIKALVAALADEKTRVSAACALLDRGWGKAAQPVTGADGGPITVSVHIDLSGGKHA